MSFDEAILHVASGKGGDGLVHFRREKYIPRGGPDGGNGGKGGDVVLEAAPHLRSLSGFRPRQKFLAEPGKPGGPADRTGKGAPDLSIPVPVGTLVRELPGGELIADLVEVGQRVIVARGGRGGRGNARYATSRNQAPRMAERGEPGEERAIRLELRLLADAGIIGLPNVGKSTLLSGLTRARPKIGDYPFTTLEPHLGVFEGEEKNWVLADIPGLIEGAHRGAGLGSAFLRHIQRTRALIHVLDGTSADPVADFSQVNTELALFDPDLPDRPQIVAVNKSDLPEFAHAWPKIRAALEGRSHSVHPISAKNREGLVPLMAAVGEVLDRAPVRPTRTAEIPVFRLEPEVDFDVRREFDGNWRVEGKAIERSAAMTYWEYDEAVRRFQRLLARVGVDEALRRAGARPGEVIRIGEYELEWQD